MLEVIEIPPGEYRVGNESIPNGSPQHRRRLHDPVWMDARPVSWDHFESFVVGGGYSTELLEGQSVDRRTRQLIEQSMEARMQSSRSTDPVLSQPVTGLTWFEAVEVAAFYRARLPYEIEWEIAHTGKSTDADTSDEPPGGPQSRFGLSILIGELQEWTLDAFSKTYWRADFDKRGVPWSRERPGAGVSVRGAGPGDMFRHVSYRFASVPNHTHVHRGFRRVWDSKPVDADIVPGWRR